MELSMTPDERISFIGDTPRVAVLSIEANDRGPVSAPIWYSLERNGGLTFSVGSTSRKAALLRAAARATLCMQSEEAPYRYVTAEGSVSEQGPSTDDVRRARAIRYLGPELGELYFASTRDEDDVTFELRPERWASIDYNKLFA